MTSVPWGAGPQPRWLAGPIPEWPEALEALNVRVFSANFSRLNPDWQGERPIDGTTTLYLVTDGFATGDVDGVPLDLSPHRLVLVPGHARMTHATEAGIELFWFRLTATVFDGLDLFELHRETRSVTLPDPSVYQLLAHRLVAIWKEPSQTTAMEATAIVNWLLTPLLADMLADTLRAQAIGRFLPVLRYVHDHLAEPLRVVDLARLVGMERSAFTRLFTAELGQSPAAWIRAQRLHRLRRELLVSDTPLDVLAERIGFADARHLGRVFRRAQGIPPGEFRRRHRLH